MKKPKNDKQEKEPKKISISNPFQMVMEAEAKYLQEFNKMIGEWSQLHKYIKPFVDQNEEHKKIMETLNARMVAMPLSHVIIQMINKANLRAFAEMQKMTIPPLKIKCPTCKKVIWDVTEIRNFLDPEGHIYGKEEAKK